MTAAASRAGNADALVIFGISGDLARVMTFRSLYRLERRGLLDCPIHGVAVDDWSVEDLREHARAAIVATGEALDEAVFERLAARLSYLQGDFNDEATYQEVGEALDGVALPVFYLEIPPFLFGKVVGGLTAAGVTKNARIVVEKPFGHDLAVGARPRRGAPRLRRRVADLPHRPLPREDGARRRSSTCASRMRSSSRSGTATTSRRADHDGGELRRADARPLLRPGRRAPRRRRQPPDAARRGRRDGAALRAATRA